MKSTIDLAPGVIPAAHLFDARCRLHPRSKGDRGVASPAPRLAGGIAVLLTGGLAGYLVGAMVVFFKAAEGLAAAFFLLALMLAILTGIAGILEVRARWGHPILLLVGGFAGLAIVLVYGLATWMVGVALLLLIMVFAFTGYLLASWWAT